MTHQEFIEKTGLTIANHDFNRVQDMYLCAGVDEASFCEDFKQHHQSKLLQAYYSRFSALETKIDALEEEKYNIAVELITSGKDPHNYAMAVKLIGQRNTTLLKLENNIELNHHDILFLRTVLVNSK